MVMSIYNEKNYLFHPETLQTFETIYHARKERWDMEQLVFEDTLKKYEEFIAELATLLYKMGYSSALECSLLVSYMIESGALSFERQYKDEAPDPKKEINCRLGTSILMGKGCCRNYANFLCDVFEALNLLTDNLYCYHGLPRRGFNQPANHVVNIIFHEGNIYGIDLYNGNRLFHFKTPLLLSEVSSHSCHKLVYKPYYEITMGESNLEEIKQRIACFNDYCKKPILNPMEYEDEIRFNAEQKVYKSEAELSQFHEKTKVLKKEIVQSIKHVYD